MQIEDKQMFHDMQEHPEKYSAEQLETMMNELDSEPDMETAWQKFSHYHHQRSQNWLKIAASIIGVIVISGITFAAIHIVSHRMGGNQQATQETPASTYQPTAGNIPSADTISVEPRVFDNVTLDTLFHEIADYYHVDFEFQRQETGQLRLHFEWKRSESLDRVIERLNNFEAVNIVREPDKLIVK